MLSTTDIIESVFEVESQDLSAAAAEYVMALKFSPRHHERIEELAERNNDGLLSPDELRELEAYNRVRLLMIRMKSQARSALKRAGTLGASA